MFSTAPRRGFSLVELVIVVVILSIIGAIAIPRMSRGAAGAADSGLQADLAVMRAAIDLYAAEHGGDFPAFATFENQLTLYSDVNGNTNATQTGVFIYGPYLREIPALKVGTGKGVSTVVSTADGNGGWVYDAAAGSIVANLAGTETDAAGTAYNAY
ncbi:MAG: prepilin-type N-terminal cleavage/methylation domain-containing protein [Planctomycetota bacterium]